VASTHLLDLFIEDALPRLETPEALAEFEKIPYHQRIAAQSTYEAISLAAKRFPDAPALIYHPDGDPGHCERQMSFSQLLAKVTQMANLLHDLGLQTQEVVSLLMPLSPESFVALLGAQAAGIASPVNPLLSAAQIGEILRASNTRVIALQSRERAPDIWDKVQQIKDQVPSLKTLLVMDGPAPDDPSAISYSQRIETYPSDRLLSQRQIRSEDTASFFHTGGTTGTPKLVRHSHGNQVYQAWVIGLMLPSGAQRHLLFGLPLFHVGGALTQGLGPLCCGTTLVLVSSQGWRDPQAVKNIWRFVEKYRPSVWGSVPTVLAAALHVPVEAHDRSSISWVSGGGSAIPVAVAQHYQETLGVPVLEVYGMTETSSVHTIGYAHRPIRLGSVGHPVPYSRVRIVKMDSQGQALEDCKPQEIGVVAMAGPGVFSGYLSEAHQSGSFVAPGWVNSGDLGRLDAEGYLWITGRAKDLVIRGGHNIDPMAIEEILYQHPAVALAAMVGQPDAYAGELPVAYVQLKPGAQAEPSELIDFVRERTPERAAVPVQMFIIEAIPLTAVGKVFKPALRWDAAQRLGETLLQPLVQAPVRCEVKVHAHDTHGSMMSVTFHHCPPEQQESLQERARVLLDPLTLRHTIAFA
jgi:fatty-acyl-CoA synthase